MRKTAILLSILCAAIWGLWSLAAEGDSPQAFTPKPDTWYRLTVSPEAGTRANRIWEVENTEQLQLKTVDAGSAFNPRQLFMFVEGEGENVGKYAVKCMGVPGKYLNISVQELTQNGYTSANYYFTSDTPDYGVLGFFNNEGGDNNLSISLAEDNSYFLNCAANFRVNFYNTYGGDPEHANEFRLHEMVEKEVVMNNCIGQGESLVAGWIQSFATGPMFEPVKLTITGASSSISKNAPTQIGKLTLKQGDYTFSVNDGALITSLTLNAKNGAGNGKTIKIGDGQAVEATSAAADFTASGLMAQSVNVAIDPSAGDDRTIANNEYIELQSFTATVLYPEDMAYPTVTYPGNLEFTTLNADGSFPSDAKWYMLKIAGNVMGEGDEEYITLDSETGENTDDNLWCFVRNEGRNSFKLYNRAKGTEYTLSCSADVTASNCQNKSVTLTTPGEDRKDDWTFAPHKTSGKYYLDLEGTEINLNRRDKDGGGHRLGLLNVNQADGSAIELIPSTVQEPEETMTITLNNPSVIGTFTGNGLDVPSSWVGIVDGVKVEIVMNNFSNTTARKLIQDDTNPMRFKMGGDLTMSVKNPGCKIKSAEFTFVAFDGTPTLALPKDDTSNRRTSSKTEERSLSYTWSEPVTTFDFNTPSAGNPLLVSSIVLVVETDDSFVPEEEDNWAESKEWFTMNFNVAGWQLKSNGAGNDVVLDKSEGNLMNANQTDAYLWCKEGSDEEGWQFFNKALGKEYVLASADPSSNERNTNIAMKLKTEEMAVNRWTIITSTSGSVTDAFCIRAFGHDNWLANPNGNKLAYWLSSITGDNASAFRWMEAGVPAEGEGTFEGGTAEKNTATPRTWTGTISGKTVTIQLDAPKKENVQQFADADGGGFLMNGHFVVTAPEGFAISSISFSAEPEIDGAPSMYMGDGDKAGGVTTAVGEVKAFTHSFDPAVTQFTMNTGGSGKSLKMTNLTFTYVEDGTQPGENPNTPAENAFTQQQIEFNKTTQSEYAGTATYHPGETGYKDWVKLKTCVATPDTYTPHVVKIESPTSGMGWSSNKSYGSKTSGFWAMEIKPGTYNVTIDDTANGDVLTGMYMVAAPNGTDGATTTIGNGVPVTATNGTMFEAKGYVMSGEDLTFTIATNELFIYEIILAFNGADLPCDVVDENRRVEDYVFDGINNDGNAHGTVNSGRASWVKTPSGSNPNKTALIEFRTSDNSAKFGWYSKNGQRSYVNDQGQTIEVDYGGFMVGNYIAKSDNDQWRIESMTMWVRGTAAGSTIKIGDGAAVTCTNTSDTYKVTGAREGLSDLKIAVTSSEVYVCAIRVTLVTISDEEETTEYIASTATRIRNLGHIDMLGFDESMVEPFALRAEAYQYDESISLEENISALNAIYLDAVKLADVHIADNNTEKSHFLLKNEENQNYLAMTTTGSPSLYGQLFTRILWLINNNGDGTFSFFNPLTNKYLAINGTSFSGEEDADAAGTKLYIDGVTNSNTIAISSSPNWGEGAIVASSASALSAGGDGANDHAAHWEMSEMTEKEAQVFINNIKESVKADLSVYEKVPALWDAAAVAEIKSRIDQVETPELEDLTQFADVAEQFRLDLNEIYAEIAGQCINKSFYLITKSQTTRIIRIPATADGEVYRSDAIDGGIVFVIKKVEGGFYYIAHEDEEGGVTWLKRRSDGRYEMVANEEDAEGFRIYVEPVNNNTAYGENEISIRAANDQFLNRNGQSTEIVSSYGYDDDGSRWIVAAVNAENVTGLAETLREESVASLEKYKNSKAIWAGSAAENILAIETAIKELDFDIQSDDLPSTCLSKYAEGKVAIDAELDKIFDGLHNEATGAEAFALYFAGAANRPVGYLTTNSSDMEQSKRLHINEGISDRARWILEPTDDAKKYYLVNKYTAEDGTEVKNYLKAATGQSQQYEYTTNASEAGAFYVDASAANIVNFTTSDNRADHRGLHRGGEGVVSWTPNSEASQWQAISLDSESLTNLLDSEIASANDRFAQMKRLPAIYDASAVASAEQQVNAIERVDSENAIADYVEKKDLIDELVNELNASVTNVTLYFTNVGNNSLIAAVDADGVTSDGKLYRQNTSGLTNANFWKLIPSGAGFLLQNPASGLYVGGNPGTSQQWPVTAELNSACTIYLDATFCTTTNMTGLSTSSTLGNTGMVFIHANAGRPVCWSGNGDCSRWIVAAATDAEINAAKYKQWLTDAMDATPWGAYALNEGIQQIDNAIAAGTTSGAAIEAIYNSAISQAEKTIVSKGAEVPVIIYSVNTGKFLKNQTDPELTTADPSEVSKGNYIINSIWLIEPENTSSDVVLIRSIKWDSEANRGTDAWVHEFPTQVEGQTATNGSTICTLTGDPQFPNLPNGSRDDVQRFRIRIVEGRVNFQPVDANGQPLSDEPLTTDDQWRLELFAGSTTRPRTSYDEAPILYYIKNVDNMESKSGDQVRPYLTTRDGSSLHLFKNAQVGSFWYVRDAGKNDNGVPYYQIVNAAYPDMMIQTPGKMTSDDDSGRLFIIENHLGGEKQAIGLYISGQPTTNNQGQYCLDRGGYQGNNQDRSEAARKYDDLSGGYSPRSNDYKGTAWIFTPVTEKMELEFFNNPNDAGNQNTTWAARQAAIDRMLTYFRENATWGHDAIDQAAVENNTSIIGSADNFASVLRQYTDYANLEEFRTNYNAEVAANLAGTQVMMYSYARTYPTGNEPYGLPHRIGTDTITGNLGGVNRANLDADAFTFVESPQTGYFYMVNGEGKFINGSNGYRSVTSDVSQAGMFRPELHWEVSNGVVTNYWIQLVQTTGMKLALNNSASTDRLGDTSSDGRNTGFEFIKYVADATGIDGINADAAIDSIFNDPTAEMYDLRGVRIDRANAAPGIYILRAGGKTMKIVIR